MSREYTEDERARLAKEGHALPDGSYPIPDCDALNDAIHAYGRAPESHRGALKDLINKRNTELGCNEHLESLDESDGKPDE